MKILSNEEFVKLTERKNARLRSMAKARYQVDPGGVLDSKAIDEMISISASIADHDSNRFLKNLKELATSGELSRIRAGKTNWQDHVREVRQLVASGEIPFGINDHIIVKENGKRGQVVDFNPDTNEYVVVINPFEVLQLKKSEIIDVMNKAK
jgi:phosphoenolpyruvate synthase/pyruvate phosphate dikinase